MRPPRGMHLHFDPVSGIAGDMAVAALVDAGVPPRVVTEAITAMGVPGLRVRFESRRRGAYVGRGFVVEESMRATPRRHARSPIATGHRGAQAQTQAPAHPHPHPHPHDPETGWTEHDAVRGADDGHAQHQHRDYADIRRLLRRAKLDADAKALAEEIFARLAAVEAALHGSSIERVTFHEVGALDSIADIVGVSAAIAWLSPTAIGSSPPVVGIGRVRTAHGIVPVPAPATAELLRGVPMLAEGVGELTTPTGAAILATVVDSFGPVPPLRIAAIGYGAGTRDTADRPNILRVMLGEPIGQSLEAAAGAVLLIESNIDDMSGQLLPPLLDSLFAAGALDAWSTPIIMKKGRPAQKISALAEPGRLEAVERAFFLNSTTLGVRISPVSRATLTRSMATVDTPFGGVRIKVAGLDGTAIGAQPEFEDCRRRALTAGVPVRRVWSAALAAATALVPVPASDQRSKKSNRKKDAGNKKVGAGRARSGDRAPHRRRP